MSAGPRPMTAHLELRMQEGGGAAERGAALLDNCLAGAEEERRVEHGEADWIDEDGGQRKRQDHVGVLGRVVLDANVHLNETEALSHRRHVSGACFDSVP